MHALRLLTAVAITLLLTAPAFDCEPSDPSPPTPLSQASAASTGFDVNERIRLQWRETQAICPDRSFRSCKDVNRSTWTDASKTQLSALAFNGIGTWSSFKFQTYNAQGTRQSTGGDAWTFFLEEPSLGIRVATRVFDEADGSYTVAVFFHKPGTYTVVGRLGYSNCLAMQEPGTLPHYLRPLSLTKAAHCYIGSKVQYDAVFLVEPRPSGTPQPLLRPGCDVGISGSTVRRAADALTWNTDEYYYWQHNRLKADLCYRRPAHKTLGSVTRLFYYGDSTVRGMWTLMLGLAREPPCKINLTPDPVEDVALLSRDKHGNVMLNSSYCPPAQSWAEVDPEMDAILRRCTGGMPWSSVPVGTNFVGISQMFPTALMISKIHSYKYDDRYEAKMARKPPTARKFSLIFIDHHACREAEHVLRDINAKRLKRGDFVMMNMGSWCTPQVAFAEWAPRIDAIAAGISSVVAKTGATFVWRSSLLVNEHVFRAAKNQFDGYLAGQHFMTDMRRMEFESYAMHALSAAGVFIWDVHALSALGLNRDQDMIHAAYPTEWAMNADLLDTFVCPP